MSQMILAQIGLVAGSILSKDFAKYAGMASLGMQLLFLKFSRDDENGGRSARRRVFPGRPLQQRRDDRLLHHAPELSETSPAAQACPDSSRPIPRTRRRIAHIKEMVGELDLELSDQAPRAILRRIDGIVYGDDPRQGYRRRRDLSIIPGWASPSPSRRAGTSRTRPPRYDHGGGRQGNAAVIFGAETSADDIAVYGRNKIGADRGPAGRV